MQCDLIMTFDTTLPAGLYHTFGSTAGPTLSFDPAYSTSLQVIGEASGLNMIWSHDAGAAVLDYFEEINYSSRGGTLTNGFVRLDGTENVLRFRIQFDNPTTLPTNCAVTISIIRMGD